MPDAVWVQRHDDYRRAGIIDIWFWHDRLGPERIMLEYGECPWSLSLEAATVGIPIGRDHQLRHGWWNQPDTYANHHLPCSDDDIVIWRRELAEFTLTPVALQIPSSVARDLDDGLEPIRRQAAEIRRKRQELADLRVRIATLERSLGEVNAA